MRIAITGSSGLIGSAVRAHLDRLGHTTVPVVRRTAASGEIAWDPDAGTIDAAALASTDAVIHLAGAGIGDRRWNDDYKRTIRESRTRGTRLLAETLAELPGRADAPAGAGDEPRILLSGSAIGYYGDRGNAELDERSGPGTGFLADVAQAWEAATAPAEAAGLRVVHLRTGIVLSPDGGALRKQLPLFKLGLGGRFGSGKQWQSWISIDDQVAAIAHLLTSEVRGPVNLTAPHPVTNAEFAAALGGVLRRPSFLPVPAFGPKLLLGSEMASTLLLEGQRVLPAVLAADGFAFAHPDLDTALRALLNR